jgi:hypothetical protein
VVDPREYQTVLEIMRLRKIGKSFSAIAKPLNANKIPTRMRGQWRRIVVKAIFDREQKSDGGPYGTSKAISIRCACGMYRGWLRSITKVYSGSSESAGTTYSGFQSIEVADGFAPKRFEAFA